MNVALWIGHFALVMIFTVSGILKSTQSRERMIATGQTSAKIVPLPFMRLAGGSELVAVVGLVLPWVTGIARVLTPVAAAGLALVMVLAAGVHTRLREPGTVAVNLAIMAVAVFVSWGRFGDL